VGNDHGVMSNTALCQLLMRKKQDYVNTNAYRSHHLYIHASFWMLNIYAVLAYLVLPVSATVELAATHIYVHVFKIFNAWQNFFNIYNYFQLCVVKTGFYRLL
jgi:hypothetical protein